GLQVDLDQCGLRRIGEGEVHVAAGAERLGLRSPVLVQRLGLEPLLLHPADDLAKRGARTVEADETLLEADLLRIDVVDLRRGRAQRLTQGAGGKPRGVAGDVRLAGRGRCTGVRRQVGVRQEDFDAVVGHAKLLGGALCDNHAKALAHVGGRGADLDRAVLEGLDLRGGLVRSATAQAGVLVGAGDAPAIGLIALAPAPLEGPVAHLALHQLAGLLQRLDQPDALAQKLAGSCRDANTLRVLQAELDGVHAQRLSNEVHVALDGEGGLGHTDAAERAGGRVAGVHHVAVDLGVLDRVRAGRVGGRTGHDLVAQRGICAAVAVKLGLDRDERAITLRARLDADLRGVPLGVEEQRLLPRVEHLDRTARGLGEQRDVRLPGEVFLTAKAAADERTTDAHRVVGHTEDLGYLVTVLIWDLRADVDGDLLVLLIVAGGHADGALRLKEGVLDRRRVVGPLDDHIGLFEALLDVAVAHLNVLEQVAGLPLLVDDRSVLAAGIDRVVHDAERLVLNLDEADRLFCDLRRLRRDNGDRVAHVANLVAAQAGPVLVDDAVNVLTGDILVREHGMNTGQRLRLAGVDAEDAGVRVIGTLGACIEHAGEDVVVGVAGAARHLIYVVRARYRLADDLERFDGFRRLEGDRSLATQLARRRVGGIENAGVAGAAAEGVLERDLDIGVGGGGVVVKERRGGHDDGWRAEPGLNRAVLDKRLLERVQLVALREALDGGDLTAGGLKHRVDAGVDGRAIDQHRADAALGLFTADLRARQPQIVAQELRQRPGFRNG